MSDPWDSEAISAVIDAVLTHYLATGEFPIRKRFRVENRRYMDTLDVLVPHLMGEFDGRYVLDKRAALVLSTVGRSLIPKYEAIFNAVREFCLADPEKRRHLDELVRVTGLGERELRPLLTAPWQIPWAESRNIAPLNSKPGLHDDTFVPSDAFLNQKYESFESWLHMSVGEAIRIEANTNVATVWPSRLLGQPPGPIQGRIERWDDDAAIQQATCMIGADGEYEGTGFLLQDSNLIMTAKHVVKNRDQVSVRFHWGASALTAACVWRHDTKDVCALVLEDAFQTIRGIPPQPEVDMRPGDPLLIVGYPDMNKFGCRPTIAYGLVSKLDAEYKDENGLIQISGATAAPGMSGSPVVNARTHYAVGVYTDKALKTDYLWVSFANPLARKDLKGVGLLGPFTSW